MEPLELKCGEFSPPVEVHPHRVASILDRGCNQPAARPVEQSDLGVGERGSHVLRIRAISCKRRPRHLDGPPGARQTAGMREPFAHLAVLSGHPLGAFHPLPLLHNNFAVVFGLVYVQLPFMVLPLYAALDRLDRSLLEASLDLGAGQFTTFHRVVIPMAVPGIISGVLVTLIPSIGAYLTPDLLGGPDSQMIANVIERQFRSADDWPFGAALSFLLMYMTFAAIALQAVVGRSAKAAPT